MTGLPRARSFEEFWPIYLGEHRRAGTRAMHYVGTTAGLAVTIYAVASQRWWLLLLPLVIGYGFAWTSHALIERNKPATFAYPAWSFLADYRMLWVFLIGRMGGELRRLNLA